MSAAPSQETQLPAGTIKRVHVNQQVYRRNRQTGERRPVFTVKHRGRTILGHEVFFPGPTRLLWSAGKPLPCGAEMWLETTAAVTVREWPADGQPAVTVGGRTTPSPLTLSQTENP